MSVPDRARCETCGFEGDVQDGAALCMERHFAQASGFTETSPGTRVFTVGEYLCPRCLSYDITGLTPGCAARHPPRR